MASDVPTPMEARTYGANPFPISTQDDDAFQKIRDYKETHKDAAEGSVEKKIIDELKDLGPILASEMRSVGLAKRLGVTVTQLKLWHSKNGGRRRRRRTMKGRRKMRKTRRRY